MHLINTHANVSSQVRSVKFRLRPECFYQLIYRGKNFKLRVRGNEKKSSENDQLTGHFQAFFFYFIFFNISRTNSKTSKVNQQSVLNV